MLLSKIFSKLPSRVSRQPALLTSLFMSSAPESKKMRLDSSGGDDAKALKIGTHDGVFHCDESLGCFLLQQLARYRDATIVRTRKQEVLDTCDVVLDVGGVYDHDKRRYDHHQKSFDLTLSSIHPTKSFGNIKLSSAGLIYAHYGHEIIANMFGWSIDDKKTDTIFDKVYENFVREIDGIDNGKFKFVVIHNRTNPCSVTGVNMFDGEPRYLIHTNLSARVGNLKPAWNEESSDEILYQAFLKAVTLTGTEFKDVANYYGRAWMDARVVVEEAFAKRFDVDPSGRIIVLGQGAPWIQHLFGLEEETNAVGQIAFVIFPEKGRDNFRVRGVPLNPDSFELRIPLHEAWRGVRDDELSSVSGIKDCIFVHSTGFIGGNKTLEGAIEMARQSLQK